MLAGYPRTNTATAMRPLPLADAPETTAASGGSKTHCAGFFPRVARQSLTRPAEPTAAGGGTAPVGCDHESRPFSSRPRGLSSGDGVLDHPVERNPGVPLRGPAGFSGSALSRRSSDRGSRASIGPLRTGRKRGTTRSRQPQRRTRAGPRKGKRPRQDCDSTRSALKKLRAKRRRGYRAEEEDKLDAERRRLRAQLRERC